jgi:hypothetical protein
MKNRKQFEDSVGDELLDRREILRRGVALADASSLAFGAFGRAAAQAGGQRPMDARSEAKKIAFDRTGKSDIVLLISGFPQRRRSLVTRDSGHFVAEEQPGALSRVRS